MATMTSTRWPLTVLHLRGSQEEMGAQHGELLAQEGGWEEMAAFYPRMAARTMAMRVPYGQRRFVEPVLQRVISASARRLAGRRAFHFPDYEMRSRRMLQAGRLPRDLRRWFVAMDVMQNTIARIATADRWALSGLRTTPLAACSSLAVWADSSTDKTLRHARNFDFPGVGIWDQAPVVVFCTPDAGLRYGFVSTRGADTVGVTAFNEAGLVLTAHTRFHASVASDAAAVVDIGHHIIQHGSSLEDAVRLAREIKSASTWGFLVSSGRERDAVVLEFNAAGVEVVRRGDGNSHLACTNRYESSMRAGEVVPSSAFLRDSDARFDRLQRAVASGPLGRADLERLLGDLESGSTLSSGQMPLAGECITSPVTVQSVVVEPEDRLVRVSVGKAPTGFGPYVTVPWDWSAQPGCQVPSLATERGRTASAGGRVADTDALRALDHYGEATGLQMAGSPPERVLDVMRRAVDAAPYEPHLGFLAAGFAANAGELEFAAELAEQAHASELGPRRREIAFLCGKIERARHRRADRRALASTVPDLLLVDI